MEQWQDIKDYEGYYQVSNKGNVKSLKREVIARDGHIKKYPEKLLKPELSGTKKLKYYRVTLSKNHSTKRHMLHRLVAKTFLNNPDNKPHVNHLDNNSVNNEVSNLEWVTHSENMLHAQKQGRLYKAQSNGGVAGSASNRLKMLDRVKQMVDQTYGCYLVIGFNTQSTIRKNLLDVCCIHCNNLHVRALSYVYNNAPNKCSKCS